jgi:hypothetical protein
MTTRKMAVMLTQTLGTAQLWCQQKSQGTPCLLPHSRQPVPLEKGKRRREIANPLSQGLPLSQHCSPRAVFQDVLQKLRGHITARQSEATHNLSAPLWTCEGTR